jgi:hypothetical protein
MLNEYFGVPCTPDTLNAFLQRVTGGYTTETIAVLDSVPATAQVGDTVSFRWQGASWLVGARFALGMLDSLLLGEVRVVSAGVQSGRAVITQRPAVWPAGRYSAYRVDDVNWDIASRYFSGGGVQTNARWSLTKPDTVSALTVETALRDSLPALLGVRNGEHWVVAEGMRPLWVDSVTARGTYSIADPLGESRTLYSVYGNTFLAAGIPARLPSHPTPGAFRASAEDPAGFRIVLGGPAWLYIEDPAGRTIRFDPGASAYVSGIPETQCLRSVRTFDADDSANSSPPRDLLLIASPFEGDYQVDIVGQDTGQACITIQAYGAGAVARLDTASSVVASGMRARYRVHVAPGAAPSIVPLGVAGIAHREARGGLEVRAVPNPMVRRGRLTWVTPQAGAAELEVFDVNGRRVGGRRYDWVPAGSHETAWWEAVGPRTAGRPALYFVRLRSSAGSVVVRVILLGGL